MAPALGGFSVPELAAEVTTVSDRGFVCFAALGLEDFRDVEEEGGAVCAILVSGREASTGWGVLGVFGVSRAEKYLLARHYGQGFL